MAIAHTKAGRGEPLLLIHGLGGSRRIWDPVLERVTAEREVIAVDLPGFGESPPLPAGRAATPANLGAAVADLCASLGVERPHLAGNSLGGWVALELAKAGHAASVCAISPAGLWGRPLGPRRVDVHALARRLRPALSPLLASSRARRLLLRSSVARPELIGAADGRRLLDDWIAAPGYDAANHEMRARVFERPDLVGVPTTIAWGSADRLVRAPRPERLPPGARVVVLDGLGHTPTWDDPDRVASLLLEASGAPQADAGSSASEASSSSPGQAPVAL